MVVPRPLLQRARSSAPVGRRVVVTGRGAVTPLGTSFDETWRRLLPLPKEEGGGGEEHGGGVTTLREALRYQTVHERGDGDEEEEALRREWEIARRLPCLVAAPVRQRTADRRTARFVRFALQSAAEAVRQARLEGWWGGGGGGNGDDEEGEDRCHLVRRRLRTGVSIGSGMSGIRAVRGAAALLERGQHRRISPHFVPTILGNSAAGRISMEYGLRGPSWSAATACAAAAHAIGDAALAIQTGQVDVMLAGGAEACLDPLSVAGFCRLRALSTGHNDAPGRASRPFDAARDGFVMGEGAAVLVLEEYGHALRRRERDPSVEILAELVGYGSSADAHHVTAPDPCGRGAALAMERALRHAGVGPADVGYVNAHATSTPVGDEIEAAAIARVLGGGSDGRRPSPVMVSSTKGAVGHLLGAAGAVEAAFTVAALQHQVIPPTRNLETVPDDGLRHVTETLALSCDQPLEVAMSNSFGFGGTNASLVFKRIPRDD
jgi:3-oxoacyl-[acyl-carrier-protein] synthase II